MKTFLPLLGLLATVTCAAGDSPRLAVVGDDGAGDFAAALTAALSVRPGIALVERDELARIGDERTVREQAAADGTALGQLLHADGLLFLQKGAGGLQARLTAVRPGIVVFDIPTGTSSDMPGDAARLADRVAALAYKLTLPEGRLVPVSLLNLRSDSGLPGAERIERTLTLLLEKRLLAVPDIVVLERRHAGAVSQERELAAAPLPPLRVGAWRLDGTLTLPSDPSGEIVATLRIQPGDGGVAKSLRVQGPSADLARLADVLTQAVAGALHEASPTAPVVAQEAREFLDEGIWAWRHAQPKAAAEALESAELLGETAPDLLAVRINLLCEDASLGPWSVFSRAPIAMPIDPRPDERADDLLQAIPLMERYEAEKGESRLQRLQPRTGDGRTSWMKDKVKHTAAQILWMLWKLQSPRAEEVRQAARSLVGYAPLEGKIPTDYAALNYADEWSNSLDEELAYYRALCGPGGRGTWILAQQQYPNQFLPRFLKPGDESGKVFMGLVEELAANDETKPSGLLLAAIWREKPGRDQAYGDLLDELTRRREALQAKNQLNSYLMFLCGTFGHMDRLPPPNDPRLIGLIRYYLETQVIWDSGPLYVWKPEYFPPNQAPALWNALEGFKARCLEANSGAGIPEQLSKLENAYVARFGDPTAAGASRPLTVTRFWHPAAGGNGVQIVSETSCSPDGSSLWVLTMQGIIGTLHRIDLGDLSSESIPTAVNGLSRLLVTSQEVYLTGDNPTEDSLVYRYDLATKSWDQRKGDGISSLYQVGNTLYFSYRNDKEGALGTFDWKSGRRTLLAGNRRRPEQNQLDAMPSLLVQSIFAGPGGKPCAKINSSVYLIRSEPGDWPELCDLNRWYNVRTLGGRTLLWGPTASKEKAHAVTLVDPGKPEPEELLGVPEPIPFPAVTADASPPPPRQTPAWAKQPRWATVLRDGNFGMRGDDLYCFLQTRENGARYHLVWFRKGESEPVRIPLRFDLDAETRGLLPSLCGDGWAKFVGDAENADWSMEEIIATEKGIGFKPIAGGFWFLPFSDIDAYLARPDGKPSKALPISK